MFASDEQLKTMEKAIAAIENSTPCEVRVVVDKHGGRYALGGLRVVVVCMALAELIGYLLWASIPQYLFYIPLALSLFIPEHLLMAIPVGRLLASKREKHDDLRKRAEQYFQKAELHATKTRNAALLYFSIPERQFFFLTDSGLSAVWPQNLWQVYAGELSTSLQKGNAGDSILELLKVIQTDALKYLGPRMESKTQNELSDRVVIV